MKDLTFNLRLTGSDRERLDALAAHHGINASSVIRMLLKIEADTINLREAVRATRLGE